MPCFYPVEIWPPAGAQGRWVYSASKSYAGAVSALRGCGRCQGCLARKTAQWATRMHLETRYHEMPPLFVTMTLADEHLPGDFSVSKRMFQLFLMRLRKQFGEGIRYFGVGEYGEQFFRPHYHAIFWGLQLSDLCDERSSKSGLPAWKSPSLEKAWSFGFVDVGMAQAGSMSYLAGYVHKKLGKAGDDAYRRVHPLTGELIEQAPEFALMSRGRLCKVTGRRIGPLGSQWADEFAESDLLHDDVRVEGRARPMPEYFRRKRDALLSDEVVRGRLFTPRGEAKLAQIAKAREAFRLHAGDLTPERLAVRAEVLRLRTEALARGGA